MRHIDTNTYIALLVIDKVERFRDSYSLTKVLSWRFGIIEVNDIVKQLRVQNLIEVKYNDGGLGKYEITNEGKEYLESNLSEYIKSILEIYPHETDFIQSLLQKPNS